LTVWNLLTIKILESKFDVIQRAKARPMNDIHHLPLLGKVAKANRLMVLGSNAAELAGQIQNANAHSGHF
jgi:hypothetical protein